MSIIPKRTLGRTGLEISALGFGGAPLGDLFEEVSNECAQSTLQAAWDAGTRYFDTSPYYGYGKSEHRLGYFLRGQDRQEFTLSTKVGRVFKAARDLKTFDKGGWVGGLPFTFHFDFTLHLHGFGEWSFYVSVLEFALFHRVYICCVCY